MKEIVISILLVSLFTTYDIRQQRNFEQAHTRSEKQDTQQSEVGPVPSPTPDPRSSRVAKFFRKYNSPLESNAEDFVEAADQNEIDYKVLASIAMVESTGGKHTPSCAKFNPFGWTSSSSPCGFWRFTSFSEAINHVAEQIHTSHFYSNFRRTGQIKELAHSYNLGNEEWIASMEYFLRDLESL